jgi:hypothetical protein
MKKLHRGWHVVAGRCRKPKEWTLCNGGSRKKLAATHREMTCCAKVARRKGHRHKGQNKDGVLQKEPRKDAWMRRDAGGAQNAKNGIKNQRPRRELCLGSERTSSRIYRKALVLEIEKQEMSIRILWRDRPPPKQKKRLHME